MSRGAVDTDQRPFVVAWELTQACDLSCEHCRADASPTRHPAELTTNEGKALLDDLARFGEDQLVVFSGGDPLKRPDLIELVEYGVDRGLTITLTPSATQSLTRDHIHELASAGLRRLALSLDGATRPAHDTFRGEHGSFAATMQAGQWAQEVGLPLQVNTTVCADTAEDLRDVARTVEDLGAVLWALFFLVPVGRGKSLESLSPARAEETLTWLARYDRDAPMAVKTTEAPMYRRILSQSTFDHSQGVGGTLGIIAGDGFMFIGHTGEITPSGFLPRSVGNVRKDDPVRCYRESDLFTRLRDRSNLSGSCGRCEYKRLCGGSRSRAFAVTGDPLAADPVCPYVPGGGTET